jgi:phospholipase C
MANYKNDLKLGRLPQVSFIIPSFLRGQDEHRPRTFRSAWGFSRSLSRRCRTLRPGRGSAFIVTFDESGGYFDHVAPPQLDAYGLGFRVPTCVISPYAKQGHLEATLYEHRSILKFIETVFGLPTLASVNHLFDVSTPGGPNNNASNGNGVGPPAPPRDARGDIGNLLECFQF